MLIEELYQKPQANFPSARVMLSRQIAIPSANGLKTKVAEPRPKRSTGRRTKTVPGRKKTRHARSMMRIDQVSKHEETSYLLDAETNEAILRNAVARDELCRYLTPLKFIEIDTWRREVPYGITKGNEPKRRWKTPAELLTESGQHELKFFQILANANEDEAPRGPPTGSHSNLATSRQGLFSAPVKSAFNITKSTKLGRSLGKETPRPGTDGADKAQAKMATSRDTSVKPDIVENLNARRDFLTPRPATSPSNQHDSPKILGRERLPQASQGSTLTAERLKQHFSLSTDALRLYPHADVVTSAHSNRSPVSSAASLLRSRKSTHSTGTRVISARDNKDITRDDGIEIRDQKTPTPDTYLFSRNVPPNTNHATAVQDVMRPRMRSTQHGETIVPLNVKPGVYENWTASRLRSSTGFHESNKDAVGPLQNLYSDPNIAYGPHQRPSRSKRESINFKVRNYYAAAQASTLPSVNVTSHDDEKVTSQKEDDSAINVVAAANQRTSNHHFQSNGEPTLRPLDSTVSVTPRIVYHGSEVSNPARSSTVTSQYTKHSPWVMEALPDPTNDRLARAERDGYYVSKKHKSVSFHLADRNNNDLLFDHNGRSSRNEFIGKNLSMVVLNVDGSAHRHPPLSRDGVVVSRHISPRGGTAETGFSSRQSQSIPVRP